jgi:hypothetical protein
MWQACALVLQHCPLHSGHDAKSCNEAAQLMMQLAGITITCTRAGKAANVLCSCLMQLAENTTTSASAAEVADVLCSCMMQLEGNITTHT